MKTITRSYLTGITLGVLSLGSLICTAQTGIVTGANSSEVHGPDDKGRCWHEVPKGYNDLSFIEKQIYKASCRKESSTCNDYSMFGTKKDFTACPAPPVPKQPAPVAPATPPVESKPVAPAPVASKPILSADGKHLYVCPKGSVNSPDGLPVCKTPDGGFVPLQEIPIPAGMLPPSATPQPAAGKAK